MVRPKDNHDMDRILQAIHEDNERRALATRFAQDMFGNDWNNMSESSRIDVVRRVKSYGEANRMKRMLSKKMRRRHSRSSKYKRCPHLMHQNSNDNSDVNLSNEDVEFIRSENSMRRRLPSSVFQNLPTFGCGRSNSAPIANPAMMQNTSATANKRDEDDPDRMFLLSLLPSIKRISSFRKLDFKIALMEAMKSYISPISTPEPRVQWAPRYSDVKTEPDI